MTFEQEPVTAGLSIKKTPLQQGIYLLDYGGFRNGTYESVDRRTSLEEYKRRNVPDAIFHWNGVALVDIAFRNDHLVRHLFGNLVDYR